MTSDIMQGKAAWARLKQGSKSWSDWVLVGHALLEGRAIAMRYAGTVEPVGGGYSNAFNDWLTHNRFNVGPSHRAKLPAVMGILPAVEAWRATLTERERRRINHPGAVLHRFRKATGDRPADVIPPTAPALH